MLNKTRMLDIPVNIWGGAGIVPYGITYQMKSSQLTKVICSLAIFCKITSNLYPVWHLTNSKCSVNKITPLENFKLSRQCSCYNTERAHSNFFLISKFGVTFLKRSPRYLSVVINHSRIVCFKTNFFFIYCFTTVSCRVSYLGKWLS